MEIYTGTTISKGIAAGKLHVYEKDAWQVEKQRAEDPKKELERFARARQKAQRELKELYEKAEGNVGTVHADIFQVHGMMLEDEDYVEEVRSMILSQNICAEYAVSLAGEHFSSLFSEMEDEYFRGRAADIRDISDRMIRILQERKAAADSLTEPCILAAEELAPSETVQMDRKKLLGFVTRKGAENSHTAILARTMGIPALSGISVRKEWEGRTVILDGENGRLILDPEKAVQEELQSRMAETQREKEQLAQWKGRETCTKNGRKISLYANVGSMDDLEKALENDAEGIGLFRSEFLYLEADGLPSEEQQFQIYKKAAEQMNGKKLIIRTIDLGADKQTAYLPLEKEENPALGCRGIRLCFTYPELFRTQLRAIYRASAFGTIAVMYPMIISLEEISRIREFTEGVQRELREEKIPFGQVEQGIMVETPAAAMISDQLAGAVDFFSIGTNDLAQYTLAIDRQNPKLEPFYDPDHPALWRMIEMVIKNGQKGGCWVGICGNLGADLGLTGRLVSMGIDELSVPPSMILPLRKRICEMQKAEESGRTTIPDGKKRE